MRVYLTLDKGEADYLLNLVSETLETKIQLSEDDCMYGMSVKENLERRIQMHDNELAAQAVTCSNEPDPPIVVRIPRRVANIETVPDDMANSPRRVGTPVTPPF